MPFYLEMSKNITQQRDIYDTVYFSMYIYREREMTCFLKTYIVQIYRTAWDAI